MPLDKFIFVHAGTDKDHEVAKRGAWVEYDGISRDSADRYIQLIKSMLENGYEDNLLISQDAGWYNVGQPKGGNIRGFAYIIEDFVPLMKNPDLDWKQAAYSIWVHKKYRYDLQEQIIGFAMKTDRYRYIEWRHTVSGEIRARELYDHQNDVHENINVIDKSEYLQVSRELAELMRNDFE